MLTANHSPSTGAGPRRILLYFVLTALLVLGGGLAVSLVDYDRTTRMGVVNLPEAPLSLGKANPVQSTALAPLEQQLVDSHNRERARAGLEPLAADAPLVEVARTRARDMAAGAYLSQTTPDGETVATLLRREGHNFQLMGENIARNNRPESQAANAAMSAFLESPAHREQVLNDRYDRVGVGTARAGDGLYYFVVVFTGD